MDHKLAMEEVIVAAQMLNDALAEAGSLNGVSLVFSGSGQLHSVYMNPIPAKSAPVKVHPWETQKIQFHKYDPKAEAESLNAKLTAAIKKTYNTESASYQDQMALYSQFKDGEIGTAAVPGTSKHGGIDTWENGDYGPETGKSIFDVDPF